MLFMAPSLVEALLSQREASGSILCVAQVVPCRRLSSSPLQLILSAPMTVKSPDSGL